MGESKNSPNLRFKFSNQELKRTPLSDLILKLESGVSVNSESETSTDKKNFGVLKTSCVFSGKFIPGENKVILEEEISRAKVSPKANTIIVSRMNTPQLVGESGFVSEDFENLFLPDRLWLASLNSKKINPRYLSFSLIAPRARANISSIATGTSGSMKNISKPNFLGIELHIPSLPEQQKIASFLASVDERIELLEQKKEKLEVYKKGVMQQLFSQQIRFKEDDAAEFPDWEERKLGEIVQFLKGKGLPKSEICEDGSFKCIHYGELFTKYKELITQVKSRTFRGENLILSEKNDVLMPTSDVTPNGLATASCIKETGVVLGGDILILRQKVKVLDGVFLSYYISKNRKEVMRRVAGSTVYHLYGSDMKTITMQVPSLEEQKKIVQFLTNLEQSIENLNQRIIQTQTWKKGLLQQMFV